MKNHELDILFKSVSPLDFEKLPEEYGNFIRIHEMWNILKLTREDENNSVFLKGCEMFTIDIDSAEQFIRTYNNNSEENWVNKKDIKWFESVEKLLFSIYKNAIKKYPVYTELAKENSKKPYTHMLMKCEAGINGRYKLGLTNTINSEEEWQMNWGEMTPNLEDFDCYELIADFFTFENFTPTEEDLEGYDHDEYQFYCCFEGFLGYILMQKVGIKLREHKDLQDYITPETTLRLSYAFAEIPYSMISIPMESRIAAVKELVGDPNNQKLILDLWADQLNDVGKEFLHTKGVF